MKYDHVESIRKTNRALINASPIAIAAVLLFADANETYAAGCSFSGNAATEAVTVNCNASHDPFDTPVSTGDFNDTVLIEDSVKVETLVTFDGNDNATMKGSSSVGESIAGNATAIDMGAGNDTLDLTDNAQTYGIVMLGDGDDSVQLGGNAIIGVNRTRAFHTSLDMGNGNNTVVVGDNAHVSATLQFGSGNDSVTINGGEIDFIRDDGGVDTWIINGGSVLRIGHAFDHGDAPGGDALEINGGSLRIYYGSGEDDTINLWGGTARTINAGGGSDTITLDGTEVTGFLRGGWDIVSEDGADEIYLLSGSVGQSVLGEKGADHIVIDGATIADGVTGDSAVIFQGNPIDDTVSDDLIEWKSGTIGTEDNPGFVAGGGGSDTIIISATEYDGTQEVTGASYDWVNDKPAHQDDGPQQDELTMQGLTVSTAADRLTHWEQVRFQDSDFTISGASWEVSQNTGNGVFLERSTLQFDPGAVITSNLSATDSSTAILAAGTTLDGNLSSADSVVTFGNQGIVTGNIEVTGGNFEAGSGFYLGGAAQFSGGSQVTIGDSANFAQNVWLSDSTAYFGNGALISGNLSNNGRLDMQNGAAGDIFTVSGTYSGDGYLLMDIDPVTGESDNLALQSVGPGTTYVQLRSVDTDILPGPDTRWQIVTVADGSGSENSFMLGEGGADLGAYIYDMYFADGSYMLQNTGLFTPSVPVYEAYPQALLALTHAGSLATRGGNSYWDDDSDAMSLATAYSSTETTEDASGVPYPITDTGVPVNAKTSVWAEIGGAHNHFDPQVSSSSTSFDLNKFTLDAGIDGLFADSDAGKLVAGLTAHYVHGKADTSSPSGDGSIDTNGYGFGGTLTWYGLNGFYADGQAKLIWYDSDIDNGSNGTVANDTSAFGYTLSAEVGQRIALQEDFALTPQAQLQYSSVSFDDFTDALGSDIALEDGDRLQGRIGLMLDREARWTEVSGDVRRASGYGIVNIYRDFMDGTEIRLSQATLTSEIDAWSGEIGFGGNYQWNDSKYVVYGEVTASTGFEDFGDSYGFGGNIGFSVRW